MNKEASYEYARDDFRYPRWLQWIFDSSLNWAAEFLESSGVGEATLNVTKRSAAAIAGITLLLGWYLPAGLIIGLWIFLDELHLRLFIDRSQAGFKMRHLVEELVFPTVLAVHMWLQGHIMSGFAALIGILGLYLLTSLQVKYDLAAIRLPNLYFLRWDRMGFFFLFIILGAWPGTRSYLWPILSAWFLPVLTFYDYLWILIQLGKKRK